jgi:hypothetical protein
VREGEIKFGKWFTKIKEETILCSLKDVFLINRKCFGLTMIFDCIKHRKIGKTLARKSFTELKIWTPQKKLPCCGYSRGARLLTLQPLLCGLFEFQSNCRESRSRNECYFV